MDYEVDPNNVCHYSYRYNTYYTGVTTSTGAEYSSKLLRTGDNWRMLFSDAAEYRKKEDETPFTKSVGPNYYNHSRWAHETGGNILVFDGSAR